MRDDQPTTPDLTITETAKRLGVSRETVTRWVHAGILQAYRLNPNAPRSHMRVPIESVQRLERQRAQA